MVRYCSPECEAESWLSYHRKECPYLDLLHSVSHKTNEWPHEKTNNMGSDQVRHNRAVQSQKMARGWKFFI